MALNRVLRVQTQNQMQHSFLVPEATIEQTQKSSTIKFSIQNFKHLSQVVLKQKIFFVLPMYFYASKPGA